MPTTKAREHITALNLKLVYLVTNPREQAAELAALESYRTTIEQREQHAKQEAARILALDPARRVQILIRMMATPNETPEQAICDYVFERDPQLFQQFREMIQRGPIGRERAR